MPKRKEIKKTKKQTLRKKANDLMESLNKDRLKLLDVKKKRQEQLDILNIQLLKNTSALELLKILLEEK